MHFLRSSPQNGGRPGSATCCFSYGLRAGRALYGLLNLVALAAAWPAWLSAMTILPRQLPPAIIGKPYSAGPLITTGGEGCTSNFVSLKLVDGALPDGLELSTAGYFSGTTRREGVYRFVLRAANGCGVSDQRYAIEVTGAPIYVVTASHTEVSHQMGGPEPETIYLRVSGSNPGLAYEVSAPGYPWLRLRQRDGSVPGDGAGFDSDLIEVRLDVDTLWPGRYSVPITVGSWRSANHPAIQLQVEVRQPPLPVYALVIGGQPSPDHVPELPQLPPRIYQPPPPPPPVIKRAPVSRFGRYRFDNIRPSSSGAAARPAQAPPPDPSSTPTLIHR